MRCRVTSRSLFVTVLVAGLLALPAGVARATDEDGEPTPPGPGPHTVTVEGTGSLTTLFASDNQFAGNTFDIENIGAMPITISSFEVNCVDGAGATFTIYYRVGTALGHEDDPTGWNVLGTDSSVNCVGLDLPTPVLIGGLDILPGELYGFYVDLTSYPNGTLRYTNGGPTTFMNSEISLTTYHGKGNPAFTGGSFFPRQWNGTVNYDIFPVELQSFDVE